MTSLSGALSSMRDSRYWVRSTSACAVSRARVNEATLASPDT